MRAFIKAWEAELGDAYVLGLVRMILGVFIFWEALGWARDLASRGYFGDVFHLPFIPEWAVASRLAYTGVLASMLVLAALATVGHRARGALGASALLGLYVLLCDRIGFHHNRYALFCFAGLLSISPCDRSFLIAGPPSSPVGRVGPLWAARLAQLQVSILYLASGGGKLLDADWRDGLVLADRLARHTEEAVGKGVPAGVMEWLASPLASSALAKLAIATELFLAVGLWRKRTRVYALWWGVAFHLTIEVTSHVELFTWLMLTIYALFATPDVHARKLLFDPSRPKGAVYARIVLLLDWLARFDVVPWQPDGLRTGHSLVVVRRDGSRATGIRALAMVARCLPLLFPLWAPIALVASFTKGGETSTQV
jgi:Vitamin K-dependent gamma-carboxylase